MTPAYKHRLNNQFTMTNHPPSSLLEAGQNNIKNKATVKSYIEYYGKFVAGHNYMDEYTKVVKYVMWSMDLIQKDSNSYRWRYKGKK